MSPTPLTRTTRSPAQRIDLMPSAGGSADPWRDLAKVFSGGGWVLVFAAIINSIIANSNAGFNAATRVFYAMARNGIAPHALARTHPRSRRRTSRSWSTLRSR